MGTSALKTDWKCIGRSGNTVDGRTIDPIALKQAAKNYDPKLFTALVWPDHLRFFNMGKVEQVKAVDNTEGGVDLFAILAPNDIYLNTVAAGQRLFTSMELLPNFRKSGEWYLTGLAATDNPASAATTEMRFSALKEKDTLVSDFIENTPLMLSHEEEMPGWFKRFTDKFKTPDPSEDDMDKAALEQLNTSIKAFSTQLNDALALLPKKDTEKGDGKDTQMGDDSVDFSDLNNKFEAQAAELAKLQTELEAFKKVDTAAELTKLNAGLTKLSEDFAAAVNYKGGTKTPEQTGGDDVTNCL